MKPTKRLVTVGGETREVNMTDQMVLDLINHSRVPVEVTTPEKKRRRYGLRF